MVVRPALQAREHRLIDLILQVVHNFGAVRLDRAHAFTEEDDSRSRTTERFVGGRCYYVAVFERAGDHA